MKLIWVKLYQSDSFYHKPVLPVIQHCPKWRAASNETHHEMWSAHTCKKNKRWNTAGCIFMSKQLTVHKMKGKLASLREILISVLSVYIWAISVPALIAHKAISSKTLFPSFCLQHKKSKFNIIKFFWRRAKQKNANRTVSTSSSWLWSGHISCDTLEQVCSLCQSRAIP